MPQQETLELTAPKFDWSTLSEGDLRDLRDAALRGARSGGWVSSTGRSTKPREIFRQSSREFFRLERELYAMRSGEPPFDLRTIYDHLRLIRASIADLEDSMKFLSKLPQVRTSEEQAVPRSIALARGLMTACKGQLSVPAFSYFLEVVQEVEPLRLAELWGMLPALKLVLLTSVTQVGFKALADFRADSSAKTDYRADDLIKSLRLITDLDWKRTIEDLSLVHRLLCLDPAGVYPRMDFDGREMYRQAIEKIAPHSDLGEIAFARRLVQYARDAKIPPGTSDALRDRLRHVGHYLVDETGGREFLPTIGYRPGVGTRIQLLFHRFPDEVYIIGIEIITLITVVSLIMSLVQNQDAFGLIIGALLLIIPATQAAVELMNYFVTAVLTPRPLAKLDFSEGVDPNCATMVAIPTLLINEKQIRQLVDDLEVRYLVNRDPNISFALLTDLPDTAEPAGEQDVRVDLAVNLIEGLNEKYGAESNGGFYLFHRHRLYNPRERAWMGWERKRGKLLDLNQLLRNVNDPFPVKAGDLSKLPYIRFVLTLDSDTQLPRGSAQRLIGTIAHPLNRALIDPELNIVNMGYGILQPRVGISVHSATRSRLASIYSGQTGYDIYSRAVSDVYQDLYGEGIFTGKGIYDVDALRQVLERRFPRNALLSHDLIEGAYARAGLVSDVEVIDDYPSHYSAYNRRKHRWLRGDWQIFRWIFGKVPDESGRLVTNPISLISKWKILDNLRRSLVEPATALLLIAGWFYLPGGPRFWTLVTVSLLFLPIYFRLVFNLLSAAFKKKWDVARESFSDFLTSHVSIFLNIAFLAHQALVALDAIVRTIVRSTITHSRLLEWETATEAELGLKKRTPVDTYLDWIPLLALPLGFGLYKNPAALPYALPFVILWCFSKLISNWLNSSPHRQDSDLGEKDRKFLREVALRTWQYFRKFSNESNNWLIPDNVQEQPYRLAERLSPTNLGFLLNARQAAVEFGFLTVSEFVSLTESTLNSMLLLPRHMGHFLNWYDNISRQPLGEQFVSSVDSGNLVASLWSLKQGCLELMREPVLPRYTLRGLEDHVALAGGASRGQIRKVLSCPTVDEGIAKLFLLQDPLSQIPPADSTWTDELRTRYAAIEQEVRDFAPWLLPEYDPLRKLGKAKLDLPSSSPPPSKAAAVYGALESKLKDMVARSDSPGEVIELCLKLQNELAVSREKLVRLNTGLKAIASLCDRLGQEMSFKPLVDKGRRLLSIGYDVKKGELNKSCYDLLASESRTATFIAVAKGETLQESWFRLGRQHTLCEGENVLISWTGTMFEYLMPVIWEKSHPETLLDRSVRAAVRVQQAYAKARHIPWGISEAAYAKTDEEGNYQYSAFGVPGLALSVSRETSLVVSPYSSCLALLVDPAKSVQNLLRMAKRKWLVEYGFYESIDYSTSANFLGRRRYELIRCWMAHHQGMSLAAICNLLNEASFQRWFHAEPLVQASDLILQERPLRVRAISDKQPRRVLSFARSAFRMAGVRSKASA